MRRVPALRLELAHVLHIDGDHIGPEAGVFQPLDLVITGIQVQLKRDLALAHERGRVVAERGRVLEAVLVGDSLAVRLRAGVAVVVQPVHEHVDGRLGHLIDQRAVVCALIDELGVRRVLALLVDEAVVPAVDAVGKRGLALADRIAGAEDFHVLVGLVFEVVRRVLVVQVQELAFALESAVGQLDFGHLPELFAQVGGLLGHVAVLVPEFGAQVDKGRVRVLVLILPVRGVDQRQQLGFRKADRQGLAVRALCLIACQGEHRPLDEFDLAVFVQHGRAVGVLLIQQLARAVALPGRVAGLDELLVQVNARGFKARLVLLAVRQVVVLDQHGQVEGKADVIALAFGLVLGGKVVAARFQAERRAQLGIVDLLFLLDARAHLQLAADLGGVDLFLRRAVLFQPGRVSRLVLNGEVADLVGQQAVPDGVRLLLLHIIEHAEAHLRLVDARTRHAGGARQLDVRGQRLADAQRVFKVHADGMVLVKILVKGQHVGAIEGKADLLLAAYRDGFLRYRRRVEVDPRFAVLGEVLQEGVGRLVDKLVLNYAHADQLVLAAEPLFDILPVGRLHNLRVDIKPHRLQVIVRGQLVRNLRAVHRRHQVRALELLCRLVADVADRVGQRAADLRLLLLNDLFALALAFRDVEIGNVILVVFLPCVFAARDDLAGLLVLIRDLRPEINLADGFRVGAHIVRGCLHIGRVAVGHKDAVYAGVRIVLVIGYAFAVFAAMGVFDPALHMRRV